MHKRKQFFVVEAIDRPWVDEAGVLRSDDALKERFNEWSSSTWDLFLEETVDRPLSEEEVHFDGYWDLVDEAVETNWEFYGPLPEEVEGRIRGSIKRLEKIKKKIIRGKFWWELSNRRLAARLGFSKSEVSRRKIAALHEVSIWLKSHRATASYLIGGSMKLARPERSRDQQIADAYRHDLRGSCIK